MGVSDPRPPGLWGDRLKEARKRRGLSQTELAFHANMNSTEVAKYEAGSRQPNCPALVRLARVLRETTDYLCGLKDDPAP